MKIHPAQQHSLEWLMARAGIPTASEFDNLLTPGFEIRKGEMPKTYLAKKLAEKWTGTPMAGFNTLDMDFGKILEEQAIPFYELETGRTINRVGLITTDDGKVGASPDGLFDDGTGIEVKCPECHTHCKYLLDGVLPNDYAPQVHGSMYVIGASSWTFLSYCRRFPPLIVTVQRDEEIQEAIKEALGAFLEQLDSAMAKLEKLNGGPPYRPKVMEPNPNYAMASDDLVP